MYINNLLREHLKLHSTNRCCKSGQVKNFEIFEKLARKTKRFNGIEY